MSELRFDGQVALVTGAGNGLGKAYAMMLASRGAKVVVNDLGGSTDGTGKSRIADTVVNEIKAMGGEAVANYDSVVEGEKLVKTAMDTWGRIDIIVNNAGILRDISFAKMKEKDWDFVNLVHLKGTYAVCKAAWPIMRQQKYGRIVNVTSTSGLYGNFGQANYAAAKMGIVGLSFTLAKEGAKRNIKCNVIAPGAGSRMTMQIMPTEIIKLWKPEFVAPMVTYLCHESVPVSGEIFEAGGGWYAQVQWARSKGFMIDITGSSDTFCPEAVRDNWEKLTDFEGENIELKPSVQSGGTMTQILQIMQNGGADNAAPAEKKKSSGGAGLRSAAVFDRMKDQIGPDVVKRMKGVIAFNVTNGKGGATGTWVVDLKSGNGSITFLEKGKKSPKRADMTLTIADKDLVDMANGDLNGQSAFMSGKLKLKGNMGLAMKLETLFRSTAKL
eukprot:g501.t1